MFSGDSKVSPDEMAHDSVSHWLAQRKLTPKMTWQYAEPMVKKETGYLVIDDAVLDKNPTPKESLWFKNNIRAITMAWRKA